MPVTDGSELEPHRKVRPVPSRAAHSSPALTPEPMVAVRRCTSTSIPSSARVRSSSVWSSVVSPPWPVGWAVTSKPWSTAQRTAAITSSASWTSRTAIGCCGMLTTHGVRTASQVPSAGVCSRPTTRRRRSSSAWVWLPTGDWALVWVGSVVGRVPGMVVSDMGVFLSGRSVRLRTGDTRVGDPACTPLAADLLLAAVGGRRETFTPTRAAPPAPRPGASTAGTPAAR